MRVYHFVNREFGLKDLTERRLKIARIMELNDPFEFMSPKLSNPAWRKVIRETKQELSEKHGLLCFSRSWQNPVQWSHYADKHRGLCFGFDMPSEALCPVNYIEERFDPPQLPDQEFVFKLLFNKFSHWSYENEYRVYTDLVEAEDGIYYKDFGEDMLLRQVIVGAESDITRADISKVIGGLPGDVKLFKARAAFKTFAVVQNMNRKLWI